MLERVQTALQLHQLSVHAVVDILILAIVIYQLLLLIRGTRSVNMILALVALLVFYALTAPGLIGLNAVHTMLGMLLAYVPIAVIVLFQNQIRRFLAKLGRNPLSAWLPRRQDDRTIEEVALAAASLASKRLGALIVIERDMGLRTFYETGIFLDAEVSYDLLMNIFTFRSPLHDGAAIISEGRIKAASCYLPLTMNPALSRTYGTRHRAAFGISEESDAVAVVVSEERGVVSLVDGGEAREGLDAKGLQEALRIALSSGPPERNHATDRKHAVATEPSDA
jgi:diadenylate cyclase